MQTSSDERLFKLGGIFVDQFATIKSLYKEGTDKVSFGHGIRVDVANDEMSLRLRFNAAFKMSKQEAPFLMIEAGCIFNFNEPAWEDFRKPKKDKLTIPKPLIHHLMGVTISTVRGILYAKTQDTEFSKFIIQLIPSSNLVKDDIVIKLVEEKK